MKEISKRLRLVLCIVFLAFAAAATVRFLQPVQAQAATATGFQTINGKTYYIQSDGTKAKGWLKLNGKTYFFNRSSGVQFTGYLTVNGKIFFFKSANIPANRSMVLGWYTDSNGDKRYFHSGGAMAKGFTTIKGNTYFFNTSTGAMKKGWVYSGGYKYFMQVKTGIMIRNTFVKDTKNNIIRYFAPDGKMARGWYKYSNGAVRYFIKDSTNDGRMALGWCVINGKTYFFKRTSGVKHTGWVTLSNGNRYYMDPNNDGIMVVSKTMTIDGVTYKFSAKGTAKPVNNMEPSPPTGTKTIRNYLLGALQPVGQALYIWGGGWNDSTRKGVSPTWAKWYNSQGSDYDYNNYRDLSVENRAKGLDCSGFVGWSAYQVMHTQSNVGSGYTVVSGDVGPYYSSMGWGTIITQSTLASTDWKVYPGDVGYNDGHTWIILGQCPDKSAVIVHSTPQAGCQIAGTPTPSGEYESQAIQLARKYMSKYPGYTKFPYHTSSGNYIRNGNYLRWNRTTLGDPDGLMRLSAEQILANLFAS